MQLIPVWSYERLVKRHNHLQMPLKTKVVALATQMSFLFLQLHSILFALPMNRRYPLRISGFTSKKNLPVKLAPHQRRGQVFEALLGRQGVLRSR